MTKSNFEKLAQAPAFARAPLPDEGASPVMGYGAVRAPTDARRAEDRPRCAVCNRGVAGIQDWLKVRGGQTRQIAGRVAR